MMGGDKWIVTDGENSNEERKSGDELPNCNVEEVLSVSEDGLSSYDEEESEVSGDGLLSCDEEKSDGGLEKHDEQVNPVIEVKSEEVIEEEFEEVIEEESKPVKRNLNKWCSSSLMTVAERSRATNGMFKEVKKQWHEYCDRDKLTAKHTYIFGGVVKDWVRESLIREYLVENDASRDELPSDYFPSNEDIDIFFKHEDHKNGFMEYLMTIFDLRIIKTQKDNKYCFSKVYSVICSTKYHPLFPKITIKIDFVIPKLGHFPRGVYDFNVNSLCIKPDGTVSLFPCERYAGKHLETLSTIPAIRENIKDKVAALNLPNFNAYNNAYGELINDQLESINREYLSDDEDLKSDDGQVNSKLVVNELVVIGTLYINFLHKILRYRMPKMIKKGWEIDTGDHGFDVVKSQNVSSYGKKIIKMKCCGHLCGICDIQIKKENADTYSQYFYYRCINCNKEIEL